MSKTGRNSYMLLSYFSPIFLPQLVNLSMVILVSPHTLGNECGNYEGSYIQRILVQNKCSGPYQANVPSKQHFKNFVT